MRRLDGHKLELMTPKRESLFGGFSPPLISFLRQAAQQLRVPEGWQHAGGHGGLHWRRGRGVRDRQGSGQHVHYHEEGLGPRLHDGLLHRRKQKRKEENHLIWFVIVPSRVSNKHRLCVCVCFCVCVYGWFLQVSSSAESEAKTSTGLVKGHAYSVTGLEEVSPLVCKLPHRRGYDAAATARLTYFKYFK